VRTPGIEKGTEQGQSSYTVVTHCPTKPQSQDCTGFKKSYKTNTANAATATATTFIVKTSSSLHSQFHWEGTALKKTALRFVILSMTEWAGQSSCIMVTWRPTKSQSQRSMGFTKSYIINTNIAMTDIFFGLIGRAHLWGRGFTLLSYSQWTSDQDQSSHTVVSWHPTKRQSWSRAGFTKSYRTNNNTSFTNTANIVKISPSLLSQSCIGKTQLWGRRPPFFITVNDWVIRARFHVP
jgi:hypothetical protein